MSTLKAVLLFFGGLVVLIISADRLVWGAKGIAAEYGISDAIIGATIIAIGTSLPELAASVASALKKHHDIAIGNIIGSNIFNLLAVLSVPGLIAPNVFEQGLFYREFLFMLGLTALLFAVLFIQSRRNAPMGKYIGTVFVLVYALYGFIAYQQPLVPA
jgi:cation:H+ antiporter